MTTDQERRETADKFGELVEERGVSYAFVLMRRSKDQYTHYSNKNDIRPSDVLHGLIEELADVLVSSSMVPIGPVEFSQVCGALADRIDAKQERTGRENGCSA